MLIKEPDMPFQRKRILIVDNNEGESQVLASMLERADYLPTTTWSGLEALELLKAREFDIALVSSYLPDLYVGDFFEGFEHLAVRPCVIVMQEGQAAVLLKSGAQR
jgi:CheY-like chemotaxis protein